MQTIRIAAGLPVATLLPISLPRVRLSLWLTVLFSAGYAALILSPVFPDWQFWFLLILTLVVTLGARRVAKSNPDWVAQTLTEDRTASWQATVREAAPILAALIVALAAALALGQVTLLHALQATVLNDRIAIVTTGALAAIFVGGIMVSFVLTPFTQALDNRGEDLPSLKNAGTYIGWFERALLFAFIYGGQPEAAAVALAAKSFARFPSLSQHHEGFAEYFLLGSLSSITFALAAAVGTRAALGLELL
jgi:hypothetical protein